MKSIRKVLAGSALAAGTLLTATAGLSMVNAAVAQTTAAQAPAPHPGGPHHGHRHGPWALLSQLGLSADQSSQIKAIMTSARPQLTTLHQQMRANGQKLMQASPTDSSYQAVVDQVSTANAGLHGQMVQQKASIRAQVFKVLTPAQQQQLQALEAQRIARMAQHQSGRGPATGATPQTE